MNKVEKGNKGRLREPWVPKRANELDPTEIERMAEDGCTVETIAGCLDTEPHTLNNHFMPELNAGRSRRKARLLAKQYDLAVNKGNVTMLVWLGKQDLGQTDRQESTAEYKTFEVIIGEPIPNDRIPPAPGAITVLEEQV